MLGTLGGWEGEIRQPSLYGKTKVMTSLWQMDRFLYIAYCLLNAEKVNHSIRCDNTDWFYRPVLNHINLYVVSGDTVQTDRGDAITLRETALNFIRVITYFYLIKKKSSNYSSFIGREGYEQMIFNYLFGLVSRTDWSYLNYDFIGND